MQKDQDAGGGGTTPAAPISTRRLDQDTHEVTWTLHSPGWPSPPATGKAWERYPVKTETKHGDVHWDRWNIPVLHLSRQAILLLAQGMAPQKLFDEAHIDSDIGHFYGPFILLKGEYKSFGSPPTLNDVVLARIHRAPENLPGTELLGIVLEAALA